jgi:cell division septal protein FtsQ
MSPRPRSHPPLRPAARDDVRYLRRDGNRKVRAARRRRTAVRWTLLSLAMGAGVWTAALAASAAARWTMGPGRFPLKTVEVRGQQRATTGQIRELTAEWMGRNLLTLDLPAIERKVREHPWIGSSGRVRIDRRLPSSILVTLGERTAGGLALLDGVVWVLDDRGLPIDRFGPDYADLDFPLVKGLDALRASGDAARLSAALAAGVSVSRRLAEGSPELWEQVSEIDVSREHEIALRLEGLDHDVLLSAEDPLRNLDSYLALRDRIGGRDDGAIDYVDLRWRDRIAVMPAARNTTQDGGK